MKQLAPHLSNITKVLVKPIFNKSKFKLPGNMAYLSNVKHDYYKAWQINRIDTLIT